MRASDRQVGGTHYKPKIDNGVEHWTYCIRSETPNLEYAASKYVTRWRNKNGVQDLEKAIHYLEKRIESVNLHIGTMKGGIYLPLMFGEFISSAECTIEEAAILYLIMHWTRVSELQTAIADIRILIQQAQEEEAQATEPGPGYVNQD